MKDTQEKPVGASHKIPTCNELAKLLATFGDKPLFSGNSGYVINGFFLAPDGLIRTSAVRYSEPQDARGGLS